MKVYITGLEGGANSASGMGVARAIRSAYPHARLVGVSYTSPGTRIQWPDFDEHWNAGPWRSVDFASHRREIEERLADGAWWISGLWRETQWLARELDGQERVLVPPAQALAATCLPVIPLATALGLNAPASISATAPDWDLNSFGRRHGWRVWLRMRGEPSQRVHSWQELHQARLEIGENAFSDAVFLQEHIEGAPEALAFAAYQGELLDSALCRVEETSARGEWLASRVEEPPASLVASLTEALKALNWTGSGALSLLCDQAQRRWAIGMQTGFPSWIFGAALAGRNLPARLLERATGEAAAPPADSSEAPQEFVRVVIEVPLRRTAEDTPPATPCDGQAHDLAQERQNATTPTQSATLDLAVLDAATPQIPDEIVADVVSTAAETRETPAWLFLPNAAGVAFSRAADLMRRCSTPAVQVRVAYSVKTNPERRLLEMAQAAGLLAETISQAEVKHALTCGFPADRIILNGPAKRWPAPGAARNPLHAVFCDSLEELRAAGESGIYEAEILGIRLRPPHYASRFGIPIETPAALERVSALVQQLPAGSRFGIHFHMASNSIGLDRWWRLFDHMLDSARTIEAASGRRVTCLDIGGGWFPDDWTDELSPRFEDQIIQRMTGALPHVRELFLEPGRALSQSSMALAVRVLEARRGDDGRIGDVVVDGSIAELAYHNYTIFPHRILWHDPADQRWRPVGRGAARILGRLCMEKDILADAVDIPDALAAGDLLVFCDAGAYDRSMSYTFGQG